MRIVFMGTPEFAVPCLSALIEKHDVLAVFTQPDKPKGRKQILTPPPVKEEALKHNIPVYQPKTLKDGEAFKLLSEIKPDVIIVVAYGKILPKEILELPRYGCINVHASLLPKYRGAAPIQWSIIDGEKETGVTAMQMDIGLDTGDMLKVAKIELAPDETGGSLFDKLADLGAGTLVSTLAEIENGTARAVKQEGVSTYAGKLDKSLGKLDFTKDAITLERLIRGLNPWPSAYTVYNGRTLKIWKAAVCECDGLEPGTIYDVTKKSFSIACGNGGIKVLELQLEGKKRMDAESFLRGTAVTEGMIL